MKRRNRAPVCLQSVAVFRCAGAQHSSGAPPGTRTVPAGLPAFTIEPDSTPVPKNLLRFQGHIDFLDGIVELRRDPQSVLFFHLRARLLE
jgi:hypothetical protein